MKFAAVLILVASAACSAAAGKVVSSKHARVPVALWVGGDDGLTQRLADALRTEFGKSRKFALSDADTRKSLRVTIPENVGWREINGRTQVNYEVRLARGVQSFRGRRGVCWETELAVCAKEIVRNASLSLR